MTCFSPESARTLITLPRADGSRKQTSSDRKPLRSYPACSIRWDYAYSNVSCDPFYALWWKHNANIKCTKLTQSCVGYLPTFIKVHTLASLPHSMVRNRWIKSKGSVRESQENSRIPSPSLRAEFRTLDISNTKHKCYPPIDVSFRGTTETGLILEQP
jgi:hypothetical protein